jgi:amidohydrolase
MTATLQNIIKAKTKELFHDVVSYRRHIHQYPELSFQEFETAKFITKILQENNIAVDKSFGENSVIGIIEGKNEGASIALRADIDALPIIENNEVDYVSKNIGIMHACGHDAHAASLIGTAIILNNLKDYINGRIILVFQPAEEKNPGGAKTLIDRGLLEKYNISKIIAQHVTPEVQTGHFCFGSGYLMASSDEIYINFSGIGGHAAIPSERSDTVLALVEFINNLNILCEELNKKTPTIIAFGKILADGAVNVVPSTSLAEGTMRTFNEENRYYIKSELNKIAENIANKYKCEYNLEIREGYPSLFNNPELSINIKNIAAEYLPAESIEEFKLRMTAEDFAFYSSKIPAVLYRIGINRDNLNSNGLHSSNFDIDENVFLYSVGFMTYIAIRINQL